LDKELKVKKIFHKGNGHKGKEREEIKILLLREASAEFLGILKWRRLFS
jgi:hypothetical protein